jgi:hypothetical protein
MVKQRACQSLAIDGWLRLAKVNDEARWRLCVKRIDG